eukprot:TRINITY_DN48573_c0_g1_i1.p1 TRINITY_DN48573_c0_g1~~TRINITY_DN48573_c0_g1_i1.p1  ORF type:complete len:571 (-),score=94.89 TRINITY_DN48573_c0_g1_i1:216-1682(-)
MVSETSSEVLSCRSGRSGHVGRSRRGGEGAGVRSVHSTRSDGPALTRAQERSSVRNRNITSGNGTYAPVRSCAKPSGMPTDPEALAFDADPSEVAIIIQDARIQISALRYPIIREMFLSLTTKEQQLRFIHACSKDFGFNCEQVLQLCKDRPEIPRTIVLSLFSSVRGRTSKLSLISSPPVSNWPAVVHELRGCLWFQEGNLTGHYALDLSKPADYTVAENCLIVNTWESEVARAQLMPDISQRGNYEMLRNETHNEVSFTYGRDWGLPSRGLLRFDFSSVRRPLPNAQAMEASEVVKHLKASRVSDEAKLRALRAISVRSYFTTQQFWQLMLCFPEGSERQDFFCAFHTRVVDRTRLLSPDFLYSNAILRPQDRTTLCKRLGHLQLLNPLHPDGIKFVCNLLVYEERRILEFLVQLTTDEKGGKVLGSGNSEKYAQASVSWAIRGVPSVDVIFTCWYETQTVNQPWRRALARQYCVTQLPLAPAAHT